MPNHFLTIGLCSRDFSRIEDIGEIDFDPLTNANLCKIIAPMPSELDGIVSSSPNRYRYVNKITGEVSKTEVPYAEIEKWNRVSLTAKEESELISKFGAADWFDWQSDNWGTKWGTYDTKVYRMGGDGSPILIEFQSAWGPPKPEMMGRITKYLCDKYYLSEIKWIGHDPSNGSVIDIELELANA